MLTTKLSVQKNICWGDKKALPQGKAEEAGRINCKELLTCVCFFTIRFKLAAHFVLWIIDEVLLVFYRKERKTHRSLAYGM